MDAAARGEHRQVVGPAPARRELLPALARVAEVRVRVDEPGHDDPPGDVALHRAVGAREALVRIAVARRDDRAVARCDPTARHHAYVAGGRTHPRPLVLERREREEPSAAQDEVGLGHSRKCTSMTRIRRAVASHCNQCR